MTCLYDQELIALYANDDLTPAQRKAVATHVDQCSECRQQVEAYAGDMHAIGTAVASVTAPAAFARPRPVRRPRWAAAGAAAAVLVLALAAVRVDAVTSRLVELFPFLHVQVLPQEEADAYVNQHPSNPASGAAVPSVRFSTVKEAEKKLGYRVAEPGYMPEGYKATAVWVNSPDTPAHSNVSQSFENQTVGVLIGLSQTRAGLVKVTIPDGAGREVQVDGKPAMLVDGVWHVRDNGERVWEAAGTRRLLFEWKGQAMSLDAYELQPGAELPTGEELMKIAESLK